MSVSPSEQGPSSTAPQSLQPTLKKKVIFLAAAGLMIAIPMSALLITRNLTRTTCRVGPEGAQTGCDAGEVCAKIDARGRSLCMPQPAVAAFELGFPFASVVSTSCLQGSRNGAGSQPGGATGITPADIHSYINTIYAIDLKADARATPSGDIPVLAGVDGTAYAHTGCGDKSDADCGWGFGNFVHIVDSQNRYLVLYAGLSRVDILSGYPVKKGEPIGAIHSTLHWQVSQLEDSRPNPETIEKPAWRIRSVPFHYAPPSGEALVCPAGTEVPPQTH
jgi:hypothetical protein